MATMVVTNRAGGAETVEKPLVPGRVNADASRPVVFSNEDKAVIDAIALALGTGPVPVSSDGAFVARANLYVGGALATNLNPAPVNIPPLTSYPASLQTFTTTLNTVGGVALTVPSGARFALISCESQDCRWTDDTTAPTASIGHPLRKDTQIGFDGNLAAFRIIQVVAGAKVTVSYHS